jgi:hypothetical protein
MINGITLSAAEKSLCWLDRWPGARFPFALDRSPDRVVRPVFFPDSTGWLAATDCEGIGAALFALQMQGEKRSAIH